jgi:transcriptional regulator with XRE-family HTH domain
LIWLCHSLVVHAPVGPKVAGSSVSQEDLRIGAQVRVCRQRARRRQIDVAMAAGVSPQLVSLLELGRLDRLSVRTVRSVAAAVGVDLAFVPRSRGAQLDAFVDEEHSAMVDQVVRRLRATGWDAMVEFSFNDYGDRGSVDVLAWHPGRRALLVVETKSRLADLGDTCRALDVKARVVPRLAAQARGWKADSVGVCLVLVESTRDRQAVARRKAIFEATFPARNVEIRRWLGCPSGPMRGLWFLPISNARGANRRPGPPERVRQRPAAQ